MVPHVRLETSASSRRSWRSDQRGIHHYLAIRPMQEYHSVTGWIGLLKAGEQGAVQQQLWNRYFQQLVSMARTKLVGSPRGMEDEEDAVLNALNSFFRRVPHGQFPQLNDRTDLWFLLVKLTSRKAANQRRRALALKRGRGQFILNQEDRTSDDGIARLIGKEPTPAMVMETVEEARRLLDLLDKAPLRRVAELKLDGYANREIAEELGVIERTVERRLALIRKLWTETTGS